MKKFCVVASLLLALSSIGQTPKSIIASFDSYADLPREVVSVHLNKTVFLKGEEIGFQAYVFEKGLNRLSLETNNLYCTLKDSTNTVIKQKMIAVEDGFAYGSFSIDSTVQKGNYTFTAFTNWMRNFSEKNHFEQKLSVLDVAEPISTVQKTGSTPNIAFIPEGGYALVGVENTFSVSIKDENGKAMHYLRGNIVNEQGDQVTDFVLDRFGVGRFMFTPRPNEKYFAKFTLQEQEYKTPITPIKSKGVNMQLTDLKSEIGIIFNLKGKQKDPYQLIIHNGVNLNAVTIDFTESKKQIKVIKKEDLHPGMNIISLFDGKGKVLAERLFFNFQDLNFSAINETVNVRKVEDSLQITLTIPNVEADKLNRLSVSVLPATTKAYNPQYTTASYLHLSPYIRNDIRHTQHYFFDNTAKKRFQFDNLMLMQGRSTYNWNTIINKPPKYRFDFEKGISMIGTSNSEESLDFFLSPLENHDLDTFSFNQSNKEFQKDLLFPYEDEILKFAQIRPGKESLAPPLYVRFKPMSIPNVDFSSTPNSRQDGFQDLQPEERIFQEFSGFSEVTQLEEVTVEGDRRKERLERIKATSYGRIHAFEKDDFRRNLYLSNYLSQFGYRVSEARGFFEISAINPITSGPQIPLMYLDGALITDLSIFVRYRMDIVDYIEINRAGIGSGLMAGGGGIIKIFTDPKLGIRNINRKAFNEIDIPLAFARPERFSNPKYLNYSDPLFLQYGAVDWHPNLSVDTSGTVSFKIPDLGQENMIFHIEGVVNGNHFISEAKEISY
ncbi:MAG: hypothetical protein AAF634_07135 [Bacteroidota bacterium]